VIHREPAAHTFYEIEQNTRYRAYMQGLAYRWRGEPKGIYFVNYENTFPWNKGGRYN